MDSNNGTTWWELPAGQTYIGGAEIATVGTNPDAGKAYAKSHDGKLWAWSKASTAWLPVRGD